jgi:hypothetical protein
MARCALPHFGVANDGAVSVSGLVGAGGPDVALRDAVRRAVPDAPVTWGLRDITGPYCEIFNIMRPIAQPGSPFLGLALKDRPVEATRLVAHELVLPIINMPDFPAYLQVDYFSHDGSVAHIYPVSSKRNVPFSANATVPLGTPGDVGPPFGTDLIIATASASPLFPPGRVRDDETMQTYLPALKTAIDAAQSHNGRVTGQVLVVETIER